MAFRRITLLILLLVDFGCAPITQARQASPRSYDLVIYGGTAAAVTAAIQSKRMARQSDLRKDHRTQIDALSHWPAIS